MQKLRTSFARGKKYGIIVMAEGVYHAPKMHHFTADYIASWLNANAETVGHRVDARGCVIGHVQRGGDATAMERVYASAMGYRAIELLEEGVGSRIVGVKENRIYDIDIDEALAMKKDINELFYKVAREISI